MGTNYTPFDQGRLAHAEREYPGSNPHERGTQDFKSWLEGWRQADEDDPLPWDDGLDTESDAEQDED